MNFPENIFKAYDIRGIYPTELNEDLAYRTGRALATMRQQELGREHLKMAVGRDMRLSSPSLFEQFKNGILDAGVDVVDIGLVSTPTFYFAVAYYNYDGGALITASHNPGEYNGIKPVRSKSQPIGKGMGMAELMALAKANNFDEPKQKGELSENNNVSEDEIAQVLKFADISKIKPMKIVADTANAMGATYLETLFKHLPQIELVKMNWELDGNFPAHQADPLQEKNIVDLKKRVVAERADIGIATDGDGDRIFFVDNEGGVLEPAILRGIMGQLFLRVYPGATICYDIRPGKITEDMILEAGGIPSVTKVGHSLIKSKMLENGAVFGGESSGHFFVKYPFGVFEAPMVVAIKLLQELSETGKSVVEYITPRRKYFHSGEINFKVSDKEKILAAIKQKYSDAIINDLDGFTFTYPDVWFNVRASNTESLLRLTVEARSEKLMKEKVDEVSEIIQS